MMLRFRRYRVFIICAFVITLLLLRASRNSQWDPPAAAFYETYTNPNPEPKPNPEPIQKQPEPQRTTSPASSSSTSASGRKTSVRGEALAATKSAVPPPRGPTIKIPELKTSNEIAGGYALPTATRRPSETWARDAVGGLMRPTNPPSLSIPDRNPGSVEDIYKAPEDAIHVMKPPGGREDAVLTATSTIHWQKMPEWFPVPEGSLIALPTGKPEPIPPIQYAFGEESPLARDIRETRLAQVKAEMNRAWSGYRKYAWTHDELKPVSKKFQDPFCGWAATMVDSLDTLWIMGMVDDFDEAVAAVAELDFTTTPFRQDIPVFETVIRYLGGLIAAYDVSDGQYKVLLDKAVELGEILMGVFDTPNRMPVLYYRWKPAFASQPERASNSVSVAELGSMAMEFTRLAQLTGEDKYYDAIARITDAFEEFQNRVNGTALPGIFPQQLDASGCNRTLDALSSISMGSESAKEQAARATDLPEPQGYRPGLSVDAARPQTPGDGNMDIEFKITPGSHRGDPASGQFSRIDKRDVGAEPVAEMEPPVEEGPPVGKEAPAGKEPSVREEPSIGKGSSIEKEAPIGKKPPIEREPAAETIPSIHLDYHPHRPKEPYSDVHASFDSDVDAPVTADGLPADWDCVPQNLTRGGWGFDSYGMGGSQDSTYEYFPKQYILLGGLVPKYRAMHEKVVAAVKKFLLFRPMTEDNRDILFSAKVHSRDGTEETLSYEYEITHLTCFLGGMFALGGKIFDNPQDVEIGSRLAAGCAWAYEVTPSGIMPEHASLTPCQKIDECQWNETEWWDRLDPNSAWRDEQMEDYYRRMREYEETVAEIEKQRALRIEAEERARREAEAEARRRAEEEAREYRPINSSAPENTPSYGRTKTEEGELQDGERPVPPPDNGAAAALNEPDRVSKAIQRKVQKLEQELSLNSPEGRQKFGGGRDQVPLAEQRMPRRPVKPWTHKEYVQDRIKNEHLPPGFVTLMDRRYILRPEAIESVWYMYRITGDPTWQETGWRMFEAIIKATQTEIGHSAIDDVVFPGGPRHMDSMESFWLAETLKYFYLLFTTPDVISLDEWVLNTEAHPFRRPT